MINLWIDPNNSMIQSKWDRYQGTELFMSVWLVLTLSVHVTDGVKNKLLVLNFSIDYYVTHIDIHTQCFPCHYLRRAARPPNGTPAPLEAQVHFILFNFLYSARSQQKSFKVTFPIEQVYTLFFY